MSDESRTMCDPRYHLSVFRGILGGYYCPKCGAFDYDGDRNWRFSREVVQTGLSNSSVPLPRVQ